MLHQPVAVRLALLSKLPLFSQIKKLLQKLRFLWSPQGCLTTQFVNGCLLCECPPIRCPRRYSSASGLSAGQMLDFV